MLSAGSAGVDERGDASAMGDCAAAGGSGSGSCGGSTVWEVSGVSGVFGFDWKGQREEGHRERFLAAPERWAKTPDVMEIEAPAPTADKEGVMWPYGGLDV